MSMLSRSRGGGGGNPSHGSCSPASVRVMQDLGSQAVGPDGSRYTQYQTLAEAEADQATNQPTKWVI